jgi:pSer/pThr/pTyr-binding forkhead associated (FHA) protein
LIRIDGERPVTHVLSRRTRIGRATGCELQIESGSVSRHHALIVVGPRESVIEDLNSTNGVLVNGRKVTRQPLCDGDAITIGETQFRYLARPLHRSPEPPPAEPSPTT